MALWTEAELLALQHQCVRDRIARIPDDDSRWLAERFYERSLKHGRENLPIYKPYKPRVNGES